MTGCHARSRSRCGVWRPCGFSLTAADRAIPRSRLGLVFWPQVLPGICWQPLSRQVIHRRLSFGAMSRTCPVDSPTAWSSHCRARRRSWGFPFAVLLRFARRRMSPPAPTHLRLPQSKCWSAFGSARPAGLFGFFSGRVTDCCPLLGVRRKPAVPADRSVRPLLPWALPLPGLWTPWLMTCRRQLAELGPTAGSRPAVVDHASNPTGPSAQGWPVVPGPFPAS